MFGVRSQDGAPLSRACCPGMSSIPRFGSWGQSRLSSGDDHPKPPCDCDSVKIKVLCIESRSWVKNQSKRTWNGFHGFMDQCIKSGTPFVRLPIHSKQWLAAWPRYSYCNSCARVAYNTSIAVEDCFFRF